jgi:hypothetical protein
VALALQPDLTFLSRVAIPEMALLLFELLAFAIILRRPRSVRVAFAAGLVLAIGLGFKGTGAPMILVLAAVIALVHEPGDQGTRATRIAAFIGAIAGSALLALGAVSVVTTTALAPSLSGATSLVELTSTYSAFTILLYEGAMPSIRWALLCSWTVAGILIAAGPLPEARARALYLGSAVWAGIWLLLSVTLAYFPERYVYHSLVPFALNVGAGVTMLQAHGLDGLRRAIGAASQRRKTLAALWLALPAAVLLTPLALAAARAGGVPIERMSHHLALIAAMGLALAVVVLSRWSAGVVLHWLAAPMLALGLFARVATAAEVFEGSFWSPSGIDGLAWLVLAVSGLSLGVFWGNQVNDSKARQLPHAYLALWAALSLAQAAPGIWLNRSYTIRDASTQLQTMLEDQELVWTNDAGGLFLGNRIRFREGLISSDPEIIVGMYRPVPVIDELTSEYEAVARFEIAVGVDQAYLDRHRIDPFVRVFRRLP